MMLMRCRRLSQTSLSMEAGQPLYSTRTGLRHLPYTDCHVGVFLTLGRQEVPEAAVQKSVSRHFRVSAIWGLKKRIPDIRRSSAPGPPPNLLTPLTCGAPDSSRQPAQSCEPALENGRQFVLPVRLAFGNRRLRRLWSLLPV